jgi:ribosomal protein L35
MRSGQAFRPFGVECSMFPDPDAKTQRTQDCRQRVTSDGKVQGTVAPNSHLLSSISHYLPWRSTKTGDKTGYKLVTNPKMLLFP